MLGLRTPSFRRSPSKPILPTEQEDNKASMATQQSSSLALDPSLRSQKSAHSVVTVRDLPGHGSDSDSHSDANISKLTVAHQPLQPHTERLTIVSEVVIAIRRKIIGAIDEVENSYYESMTFDSYLQFITHERLTRMPHRGSRWDRILKNAEFFGVQLAAFSEGVSPIVTGSDDALATGLANARLLIEMGPNQESALEPAFNAFYRLGLLLSFFYRNKSLFQTSDQVQDLLGEAFAALIELVGDIALHYRKKLNSMRSSSVTFDFNAAFGDSILAVEKYQKSISKVLWEHNIRKSKVKSAVKIATIQDWLVPRDATVKLLTNSKKIDKAKRTEYTCEWLQRHLLEFLRSEDRTFMLNGPVGCGKSVLTDWLEERLQRPLGRKYYETFSFSFESDISSELTASSLLKNLAMQLLDRNVGDLTLYLALAKAYEASLHAESTAKTNDLLVAALHAGLKTLSNNKNNVIILVDGLDQARGEKDITKKLHEVTSGLPNIRSVIFSRDAPTPAKGLRTLAINVDHTHDDIRRTLNIDLENNRFFAKLDRSVRDKLLDQLVHTAKGSYLWAFLTLKVLLAAEDEKTFQLAIEKPKAHLEDVVKQVIGQTDFSEHDIRRIVQWSLISERPFKFEELTELLHIDLQKKERTSGKAEVKKLTRKISQTLMITTNGVLRFRHSFIRSTLLKIAGHDKTFATPPKEIESKLTQRLLFYIQLSIESKSEPSLDLVHGALIHDLFHKHHLLEYSVRYWAKHFRDSNLNGGEKLVIGADFKSLFPSSSLLTRLEWACWGSQLAITEVLHFHELALRVRQAVFGEKHECVLQSYIVIASINRHISHYEVASKYFYLAVQIGKVTLSSYSSIITACTTNFLTCVEYVTITTRTTIATYKEEMLKVIIDIYIHQHGKTSDIVIKYYRVLAAFYISIHEESCATTIYHILYEIIILRYGPSSPEAKEISDELMVKLNKDQESKEIEIYRESLFKTCEETLDVWDIRRIKITLELAWTYECRGRFELAEELYIEVWQRITEIWITKKTTEVIIAKFDICIAFVEFLRRRKRIEEAGALLICIWEEHRHETHDYTELIIIKIKLLGTLMKACGLFQIAIKVFSAVWGFFKKHNKCHHDEAREVTILISETIEEEITRTTTTTSTTVTTTKTETKTVTEYSETLLIEIFETLIKSVTTYKAYVQIIKTCSSLVSIYFKLQLWSKAISILTRTLEITWRGFITLEGECSIPVENRVEIILISLRFAECHHHQRNFEIAEKYYLWIYRACLKSLKCTDEYFQKITYTLIAFYESYHRHELAIKIYEELLVRYRAELTVTHHLKISLLYKLGGLYLQYGRTGGYKYYIEIVTVLNKGRKHCHHDALEACIILSHWYFETQRWEECHRYCKFVWDFVCHEDHKKSFDETYILVIYNRYITVCRYHWKVEFSVLRKIVEEYRDITIKLFGVTAEIYIEALIQLAIILELREECYEESLTIYEKVIKLIASSKKTTTTTTTVTTTTTTISTTTVETVRRRLVKLYVTVIKGSKSCSHERIERAIALCEEHLLELKISLGCWHARTLEVLAELTILYKRQQSWETRTYHVLQVYLLEIITQCGSTSDLFFAAITLAGIFVSCGFASKGFEISKKLRQIIIVRDITLHGTFSFKYDGVLSRSCYVFIIAFEETLHGKKQCNYTEVMADFLIEIILYEKITRLISIKTTKIETLLIHGSRLRRFLVTRKREHQLKVLDAQLFAIFLAQWGATLSVKETIKFSLYITLIEGVQHRHTESDILHVALHASDVKVKALLTSHKFEAAYDLATALFQFLHKRSAYDEPGHIGYGFRLSLHLASHGLPKPSDAKLGEQLLQLSRTVIRVVFEACKTRNISLIALNIADLNNLIALLGEQRNYTDLDFLLSSLWQSRHSQKTWPEDTLLRLGRLHICAAYLANKHHNSITLAEDIAYNLRRAKGSLHSSTIEFYGLLSELYTSQNRNRDAMGVHEELLRLVIYDADSDDDGFEGVDEEIGKEQFIAIARSQLGLLKATFNRLGGFDKSVSVYTDLYKALAVRFGAGKLGVESPEKWKAEEGDERGVFHAPKVWEMAREGEVKRVEDKKKLEQRGEKDVKKAVVGEKAVEGKRPGWGRRISGYWGVQFG